jgi:hypothetical protein
VDVPNAGNEAFRGKCLPYLVAAPPVEAVAAVQNAMGMDAQVPRSTGMCRSGAPQSGLAFFVKPRGFSLPHAHCAVDISIIQTATVNRNWVADIPGVATSIEQESS